MSKGAAYLQLNRTNDSLGENIRYFDSTIKARQAEERAREERSKLREDAERKEWKEKWGLNIDDFQNQYTGFTSYDDVARDFSNHAIQRYVDLQRKAMNTSGAERRELETQMAKVKNSFSQFAGAQETYAKMNEDYMKAVSEGKVSGVDAERWESLMQAALLDYNIAARLDDNNNLMYLSRVKGDDGKLRSQIISNIDLVNGNMTPYSRQDIEGETGIVNDILSKLGKNTIDERTGSIIKTSQTFGDRQQIATNDYLDSLLQSDEVLADIAFQFGFNNSKKRTGFSTAERKRVKDRLFGLVEAGYDTEESIQVNTSLARLALDRQKEARLAAGATDPVNDINVMTDAEGNALKTADMSGPSTGFTLPEEIDFNDTKIKEVFLDADNRLTFIGRKKVKGGKNLRGETIPDTFEDIQLGSGEGTDENLLASKVKNPKTGVNFANKKELVDYLKSKLGKPSTTTMTEEQYQKFLRDNGL